MRKRANNIIVPIFLGVICADQLLKMLFLKYCSSIISTNTGGAFGIGGGFAGYTIFTLILIVFALILMLKRNAAEPILPYLLIISGASSNLLDRIFRKAVIDYINVSFFASFNLADSLIVIGALWLVKVQLFPKKMN